MPVLSPPETKRDREHDNSVYAELNEKGDRIEVRFGYDRKDIASVKAIPGARFSPPPVGPVWLLPRDLTSARMLRTAFGDRLKLGERVKAWARLAVDKETKLGELTTRGDAELVHVPKDLVTWMRNYQRAGAAFMAETSCINADQPGLGKTVQTIASIIERCANNGSHLIVAPKTSLNVVWEAEIEEHTDYPVITISGDDPPADRKELLALAKEFHDDGTGFFLVLNPAFVRYEKDKEAPKVPVRGKLEYQTRPVYPELFEFEWDTVVFDEYHKMGLSNNKTQMFAAANDLRGKHKILLSGTPMGGKPVKLWGALHFLEPERFTSKWRWVDEWLVTDNNGYGIQVYGVQPGKEDAFWEHIKPYMVRRTKAEVLKELPPKQYVERWCEMTAKQKKQYEAMATAAEVKIEEENLTATGILAEYMRLKQFAGSHQKIKHMANGDLKVFPTGDSGKLPHLLEILEERGISKEDAEGDEQVVIFSQFSTMVDMICDWLNDQGIAAEKITGAVSQARRTELVERFQAGEVRVMVVTTTAGGVALTLDKASTAVIMDETWDPDDQEQAEDRVHRASRIHQVTVYYLRTRGSIEEYIRTLVGTKKITNREILDLRRMGLRAIQ